MEEQVDLIATDSQLISNILTKHKRVRKLTQNEASFKKRSQTLTNGQKSTHANSCSTSKNGFYANQSSVSGLYRPAPFSDDPEAVLTREKCDYSIKITKAMAASGKAPRPVRVYADGIYDLFHKGHARLLMQAKNAFPSVYLIAGVNSDFITHQNKGITIMTDDERYEVVRHCRYVDEVAKDADWIPHDKFLEENKIDFVAHDDLPCTTCLQNYVYKYAKDKGMFVATERTDGISTSDLVARIIKNYDLYARRNLERGYTGKDMNLSFINEKKFLLQNKVDKLREKFVEKRDEIFYKWQENARQFINNFLGLFGKNGGIKLFWESGNERLRQAPARASTRSPKRKRKSRSSSPSPKPGLKDIRSTRRKFKNHLTSNYVFLFTILLFSLFIPSLMKYQN